MILVLDASVALKWFLDIGSAEPDSERAVTLLAAIRDGSIAITQPVHFVAEVASVADRRRSA